MRRAGSAQRREDAAAAEARAAGDRRRSRRRRRDFLLEARPLTRYVAAESRQLTYLVPTLSEGKLFVKGRVPEFRVLDRAVGVLRAAGRLRFPTTFVDVGAHVGTTTIPALALHPFARALAIEPDPENVRLLRANLALNGLEERAVVLEAAASDRAGRASFLPGGRAEGAYNWTKGRLVDDTVPGALAVETVTLDGLVADGVVDPRNVGLLWLDCQKHEERALQAASAFVRERVPIVFALRPRLLSPASPLVVQLLEGYEQVVHLRGRGASAGEPAWTPEIRPVEALLELCERTSSTDLLVGAGLDVDRRGR